MAQATNTFEGFRAMKTLVTANQKGGVGKTSTLVHLAFDFLERGLRVAVIDLDTQANASFTLQHHKSGQLASHLFDAGNKGLKDFVKRLPSGPMMQLIESDAKLADMERRTINEASANFKLNIDTLKKGFDVILIDTAPSLGVSMVAALFSADFVLSPIELEAYSIQGIKKMVTTIANVRKTNKSLQFLGMMPSKVDARNPRHARHLGELERAYPQLLIPARIGLRSSIADALASGIPVWKIKKTAARKAAQEVRALASYVFDKLEIA
ncbi:ParA family protein [Methyloterricola oryzae]|uniref:ParA family protein n=1 Tax=Methyloterricola oryzae TaxID=1495050 RepID=UPI000AB9B104